MKHTALLAALAALPLCGSAQETATTNDTQKGETTMPYVTLNDGNRMRSSSPASTRTAATSTRTTPSRSPGSRISPHFRAYKEGTPHMIESLRLAPMRPLDPSLFPEVFRKTTAGRFW